MFRTRGFGDADLIIYARAEAAMERVLQRAERSRAWTLDANDIPLFEAVLRQSDRQLANAPRHVHLGARYRLDCFVTSQRASPLRAAATDH
jgi:saccharopine dehydrogenase-like NADP-dependent oxidoreductase